METGRRKRKSGGPREDLTGQRFGSLVVIGLSGKQTYPSGESKYLWNCQCDCGNTCTPTGNSLKRGNTQTCRKCIYTDIAGQKFGKLTAVSRLDLRNSQGKLVAKWHCECSCGNTHLVTYGNLFHGNVKSCGCLFDDVQEADFLKRKEEFLTKVNLVHEGKYLYNLDSFNNFRSQIEITCTDHGVFYQRLADHLAGTGCPPCSVANRALGNQGFISRAKAVHGERYNYDLVEYTRNSEEVLIVCPEHGKFYQIAASHLSGSGCKECATSKRVWGYRKYCLSNPEVAQSVGTLYLLKLELEGEEFLKVGVSIGFLNRLAKYRQDGFKIEVLCKLNMLAIESADYELKLLRYIKKSGLRYVPSSKFAGWTECATCESKQLLLNIFQEIELEQANGGNRT